MSEESGKSVEDLWKDAESKYDGKYIKNKLPFGFAERFGTEKQWLSVGMHLKEDAEAFEMHKDAVHKKLYKYYYFTEVERTPPE